MKGAISLSLLGITANCVSGFLLASAPTTTKLHHKMSMNLDYDTVMTPFIEKRAVKIISGLKNFDKNLVRNVAQAAEAGGATHIDIACRPDLVQEAKAVCNLPVCVSSVDPREFVAAVAAGADMVEIGNFDSFYDDGIQFRAEDVIAMTEETKMLVPNVPISVTVPYHLTIQEQIALAKALENMGTDVIQTEGRATPTAPKGSMQEIMERASPTLGSTFAIAREVSIPVMAASGLAPLTVPIAFACGGAGVGVGQIVNREPTLEGMVAQVRALVASLERGRGLNVAPLEGEEAEEAGGGISIQMPIQLPFVGAN